MGEGLLGVPYAQSWAEILAAIGTVGALAAALRALSNERRRTRSDQREADVAQSRLIYADVIQPSHGAVWTKGGQDYAQDSMSVFVTNASTAPIYNVHASVTGDGDFTGYELTALEQVVVAPNQEMAVVTANRERHLPSDPDARFTNASNVIRGRIIDYQFTFTDAAGRRWRRINTGEPTQITAPRLPKSRLLAAWQELRRGS